MVTNLEGVLQAFGNGTLFGESYGDGPVQVVFLHGWGRSSADFRAIATELAEHGISSVAVDLPGFGASPLPETAGGARLYADIVISVLPTIADGPVLLVGHSLGGRVAAVVAATAPERLSGVLFIGAPLLRRGGGTAAPWRYRVIRFLAKRHLVSATSMERARQRYGSADYRAASGLLRDILVTMVNESYDDELGRITTPAAFLWGANDTAASVAMAREAAALVPGPTTMTVLDDCGHLVPTLRPDAVVAAVREAL